MYQIFVTEGVVLAKRNVGEANALVSVLTREHGLLRAKAAATRAEKSKLRYGIEPLTFGKFSFVEGRHEWKLIGVEDVSQIVGDTSREKRAALGRIAKLISRLVQGEERVPRLFEDAKEGLCSLAVASSHERLRSIECILVLRILSHLGYLAPDSLLQPFLTSSEYSPEVTEEAAKARSYLIRMINDSLAQTGL